MKLLAVYVALAALGLGAALQCFVGHDPNMKVVDCPPSSKFCFRYRDHKTGKPVQQCGMAPNCMMQAANLTVMNRASLHCCEDNTCNYFPAKIMISGEGRLQPVVFTTVLAHGLVALIGKVF